jgi:hypothetical protein
MTEEEVAEILGGPPGDYTNGQGNYDSVGDAKNIAGRRESCATWCGHRGAIEANFDAGGKLTRTFFFVSESPPNVWVRIRNYFIPPKRLVIVDTDGASSVRDVSADETGR